MLFAALPREGSLICRVIGLDAHRERGAIRVGLLLVDGGIPAQDAPARFFPDPRTEELLCVRLPDLQDAIYEDVALEVISFGNP